MPSLDFKGKAFVYAHHLTVPFRELVPDAKKSCLAKGTAPALDGNLIMHGDNLHALKALLPLYAGKVDCVIIDPPYNTGNEGWCYNDNVRSPIAKEWLKKASPVDREDLERHDKWASMMWPRLKLLHELMAEDGVIFVSIDDNEIHRLRALMDEIFGEGGFAAQITVLCNPKGRVLSEGFADTHEYALVYTKYDHSGDFSSAKSEELIEREYTLLDENDDRYREMELRNTHREFNRETRDKMWFPLFADPKTGKVAVESGKGLVEVLPIWDDGLEGCWTWGRKKAALESEILVAHQVKNRWKIYRRDYAKGSRRKATTVWNSPEVQSEKGQAAFEEVMNTRFPHPPKAIGLIEKFLQIGAHREALVLDSFGGSGTTAHAVLAQNKKDHGKRRFIIVECEDYADSITAERVRRVILGYPFKGTKRTELMRETFNWKKLKKAEELVEKAESVEKLEGADYDEVKITVEAGELVVTGEMTIKDKAPGLPGAFTYCTLGAEMSLEGLLTGKDLPAFDALAKYVFYTATGRTLATVAKQPAKGSNGFIGEAEHYRVHLLYQPDQAWLRSEAAVLTETKVEAIVAGRPAGQRSLVFAAAKYLSQKDLTGRGVEFCQLPYAIHRILGESAPRT
jgi:adenine-specific DNA-methyltransferase